MGILVADDTKSVRSLIQYYLASDGLEDVILAGSAEAALRRLEDTGGDGVDLVLMDVVMPSGMDGIEACMRIKAHPDLEHLPVIIITSDVSEDSLEAAFNAGAADYIEKPLKKRELLVRVRAALRLKEEVESRRARERELLVLTKALEDANKQLHLSNEKLQRLSVTDALTGIANRRYFESVLDKEVSRARRHGTPLTVIMADIDCFKQYNDHYGHQAGDACLRDVALAMRDALRRPADMLARYGGEEFVAIIPGTDAEGAQAIAQSMRENVLRLNIPHAHSRAGDRISISLGIAQLTHTGPPEGSSEDIVRAADRALYQAKETGRNRVITAA